MDILDLLRSDGSIIVNKKLAKEIGLNEAVILSELISRMKWHESKEQLNGGWFYCTTPTLKQQTSLNRYYQDKAIDKLINLNLIDKKVTGIPAKRYFKINGKQVFKLVTNKFAKDLQTRSLNSNKQGCESFTRSNNELNNTKDNTNNKNTDSVTNVQQKNNNSTPEKEIEINNIWGFYKETFIDYYQPRTFSQKRKSKIKARLKTYTTEELKQALVNMENDDYITGKNENNKFYANPEYCFRNDEIIEKWLQADNNCELPEGISDDEVEEYLANC